MSDLIRREEAIEMLQEAIDSYPPTMKGQGRTRDSTLEEAIDLIKSIPAAEPLVTVKAKQNEGLYLDTDEETLLETEYIVVATDGWYKEYIHETDGKPKVGKWIIDEFEDIYSYTCTNCRCEILLEKYFIPYDYCPNCGVKMKGEYNGI